MPRVSAHSGPESDDGRDGPGGTVGDRHRSDFGMLTAVRQADVGSSSRRSLFEARLGRCPSPLLHAMAASSRATSGPALDSRWALWYRDGASGSPPPVGRVDR
jgi:hypothetical protein